MSPVSCTEVLEIGRKARSSEIRVCIGRLRETLACASFAQMSSHVGDMSMQ